MKKTIYSVILIFILAAFNFTLDAQPQAAQWPFYLAFEDATGARDTLWFLHDVSATGPDFNNPPFYNGHDSIFHEVPVELSDTSFNVWFLAPDSIFEASGGPALCCMTFAPFKVVAEPFFGFGALAATVFADNYQLPITLRWDSTLFNNDLIISVFPEGMNNSRMDNDYLFNFDKSGAFCMPQHPGELVLPPFDWFSQEHFPLWIQLTTGNCSGLSVAGTNLKYIKVYPNPASNMLKIDMEVPIQSFQIINLQGKTVLTSTQNDPESLTEIDVSTLSPGMYLLMIRSSKGQGIAKFLKD
jgi:hypothetical protein